jgi:hypothetical protein
MVGEPKPPRSMTSSVLARRRALMSSSAVRRTGPGRRSPGVGDVGQDGGVVEVALAGEVGVEGGLGEGDQGGLVGLQRAAEAHGVDRLHRWCGEGKFIGTPASRAQSISHGRCGGAWARSGLARPS